MKKLSFLLSIGSICLVTSQAEAQVHVSVNINVDAQPQWGPTGYDRADYYYLPAIETYYNVPEHQFVYFEGGRWIFAAALHSAGFCLATQES